MTNRDFWEKVNRVDAACWEWLGAVNQDGYGKAYMKQSCEVTRFAHRIAWILTNGPITKGFELDHACRNRRCVRPDHLRLVPSGFNLRQGGEEAARLKRESATCRNGHRRAEVGFHVEGGRRMCELCYRLKLKRRWQKAKLRARQDAGTYE